METVLPIRHREQWEMVSDRTSESSELVGWEDLYTSSCGRVLVMGVSGC